MAQVRPLYIDLTAGIVAQMGGDTILPELLGTGARDGTKFLRDDGTWQPAALADGDKGDITVSASGAAWTIDNSVVTYAKIQNVSATDKLLGRSTAGAGVVEEIACTAAGRAIIDDLDAAAQRTTLGLGAWATVGSGTGPITISATGVTSVTAQTGTGTEFVMSVAPSMATPVTVYGLDASGSALNLTSFPSGAAIVATANIGGVVGYGWDGDSLEAGATINFRAAENWSATARGSRIQFRVVHPTTTTLAEAMSLESTQLTVQSASAGATFNLKSVASGAAAASGSSYGGFAFYGWDGDSQEVGATINARATATWSNTERGSRIQIRVCPTGSTALTEIVSITGTGVSVTGTLAATGAVSGASLAATGAVSGASLSVTGDLGGATATITGAITGASLAATGAIASSSASAGIGYATGAGGTVTQLTSKSTSVILNKICGRITTHDAALAAGASVAFDVANNTVAASDTVVAHIANIGSAFTGYRVEVVLVSAGGFNIRITNITAGSLSQALPINFHVTKVVTS